MSVEQLPRKSLWSEKRGKLSRMKRTLSPMHVHRSKSNMPRMAESYRQSELWKIIYYRAIRNIMNVRSEVNRATQSVEGNIPRTDISDWRGITTCAPLRGGHYSPNDRLLTESSDPNAFPKYSVGTLPLRWNFMRTFEGRHQHGIIGILSG